MPNQTTNYKLTKPLASELYDIDVLNDNMDIIDTTLKDIEETTALSGEVAYSDIDNITESGFYRVTSSTNKENGALIHFASNGMHRQIADFHNDGLCMMTRMRYSGGSWGAWDKIFDSTQAVPVANGGTGAKNALDAITNLNGVPVIDAQGASYDMNTILDSGVYGWYEFNGGTLNTAYKEGLTGTTIGYILNVPTGATSGSRYGCQFAIHKADLHLYYRAIGGTTPGAWRKITTNQTLDFSYLWQGTASTGTTITFADNIWNYQLIGAAINYCETGVVKLVKGMTEPHGLAEIALTDSSIVNRVVNLEIAADGMSAKITGCKIMEHVPSSNHTAFTDGTLTHVMAVHLI